MPTTILISSPAECSSAWRSRALWHDVRIFLLMDEPFSALDAMMRVELQDLLLWLWREFGFTIVFVTHDLDEALYLAQRVVVLSASPGTVAEVVDVPLPYPRNQVETRARPAYLKLREHLYRSMVQQVSPAARSWHEPRVSSDGCRRPADRECILILLLLALWQFSALYIMDTPTWPPVTRIFEAWFADLLDGSLVGQSSRHIVAADARILARGRARHRRRPGRWAIIGSPTI